MKFGKQLEQCMRPQWREHYIQYKSLKKRLADLDKQTPKSCLSRTGLAGDDCASPSILGCLHAMTAGTPLSRHVHLIHELDEADEEDNSSPDATWHLELEAQAQKVRSFVNSGLKELENQLAEILGATQGAPNTSKTPTASGPSPFATEVYPHQVDQKHMELRLLESLGRVSQNSRQLREFEEINHVAVFKILKKHNKARSAPASVETVLPALLKRTGFDDQSRFEALQAEMNKVQLSCACVKGLKAPVEVVQLAAGLDLRNSPERGERQLWFFIGSSIALMLPVFLLLAVPPAEPETYSNAQFLSSFPAFYCAFWVIFSLWCVGCVGFVCDSMRIDHKFLLGFDKDCVANPLSFFRYAAGLTTVWIVVFTLYICDYKWMMSPIFLDEDLIARSAQHFIGYPVVVLCILACCTLCPSNALPARDKLAALRSLGRTMFAPCFKVSFGDNIMGDALTSLVKPLQDISGAVCYFAASHPHTKDELEHFSKFGHMCPQWDHDVVDPIIAALPLVFRALQCLRRFHDAPTARKHLLNFVKYLISLAVVVAAAVESKSVACIVLSAAATIYSATWDIKMDWGLSFAQLMSSPMTPMTGRRFPPLVYICASVADVALRLLWVLSLFPISAFTHGAWNQAIFRTALSALELLRRSMWVVLRIEHEQAATSSGTGSVVLGMPLQTSSNSKSQEILSVDASPDDCIIQV